MIIIITFSIIFTLTFVTVKAFVARFSEADSEILEGDIEKREPVRRSVASTPQCCVAFFIYLIVFSHSPPGMTSEGLIIIID